MKAILISCYNGHITERELGNLAPSSFNVIRTGLAMYANRLFGREGKDWRIVQKTNTDLVPFYVRSLSSPEEIHAQ